MKCGACSSDNLAEFLEVYDDRYGYPGYSKLFRCKDCGHKMLDAELSEELLTRLYSDYYPRSELKLEDYKPGEEAKGFGSWLDGAYCQPFRWVPKGVRVLDIGCGFGQSLGYYEARGCDAYGVEVDENIRRVAEKFGFKVDVGVFNPDIYEPAFFDYVTMAQVIEHVADPVATLKGLAKVLKPGGVAVLSTPNSNGWGAKVFKTRWINWHAPYHLQHFSVRSMRAAAEKAGLVVKEWKTITSSEWLFYQWIHLATRPKMGEPSGFWTPKRAGLTQGQRRFIGLMDLVHRRKINHLITRVFDGLGLGDNFIFILVRPSGKA
jgi:2-polyprenyl-3-methyl-5-hydroxy-6-metoxy-1,4-benzoquinol methylase